MLPGLPVASLGQVEAAMHHLGKSYPHLTIVAPGGDFTPVPLLSIAGAIGGGPLILRDGSWFDDVNGPNGGEYAQRIPSTGAAITPDGTLLLLEVDGRQPSASVGFRGMRTGRPALSAAVRFPVETLSTAMIFTRRRSAFTATQRPASRPPPPTGQTITSTSGTCSRISRPSVPWPAMMSGSS